MIKLFLIWLALLNISATDQIIEQNVNDEEKQLVKNILVKKLINDILNTLQVQYNNNCSEKDLRAELNTLNLEQLNFVKTNIINLFGFQGQEESDKFLAAIEDFKSIDSTCFPLLTQTAPIFFGQRILHTNGRFLLTENLLNY